MSIPFVLDEKSTVVTAGPAGERSRGARKVPWAAFARTQSKRRRRPALASGFRLSDCLEKIDSPSRRTWRCTARQAQMAEDLDDQVMIFLVWSTLWGTVASKRSRTIGRFRGTFFAVIIPINCSMSFNSVGGRRVDSTCQSGGSQ